MNSFETNVIRGLLLTVLIGLLMACGGGGGGGGTASTSEPVVAKGVITQLGSIWVNGVEYETPDGGSYSNDDSTSNIASYEVGQVVTLIGTRNADGVSGTATVVEYEPELEGKTFDGTTINGVTIITDQSLTSGTGYAVSGFWINDTTLQATSIGPDDGDLIDEVKGRVDVVVDATSITVNGVVYLWANASDFSVGNIVEVHFDPTSGPPFQATDVELEDGLLDNPDDGLEAEIEGPVNLTDAATCPSPDTSFMIGFTCIDWDLVDRWEDGLDGPLDLVSGLRVEAEGHYVGDVLIAEKIKGRGNQVRITAIATNIDGTAGTLDVFGGDIQVTFETGLTEIENGGTTSISSDDNNKGFEIRGIRTDTTGPPSVLALRIRDKTVGPNDHELRAEVDVGGVDSSSPNIITVMGISSIVDSMTQLVDEDATIWAGNGTDEVDIDIFLESIDNDGIVTTTNGPNDVVDVQIVDITVGAGSLGDPYTAKQVEIEREDD